MPPCRFFISIQPSEYPLAQGAFRSGKYKFIASESCSGWYTFSARARAEDPLTNGTLVCDSMACGTCSECKNDPYYDYLYDLEADPREEHNLIEVYPEVRTAAGPCRPCRPCWVTFSGLTHERVENDPV